MAKTIFIAFGELAVDVRHSQDIELEKNIEINGGISAFNTLYNLAALGMETYAIGGVGTKCESSEEQILKYYNKEITFAGVAINSLKEYGVNTDNVEPIYDKNTNAFYICDSIQQRNSDDGVQINRASPITGKSSIEWSDKLNTNVPEELKDKDVVLIVSNFEPVTRTFVKNVKEKCKSSIISLDITNGIIFQKYTIEEIIEYLQLFDLIQCNEETFESLREKLDLSSPEDFFSKIKANIFTLTKGSNGATFYYRDDGKKKMDKKPKKIAKLVDNVGAGDAFHSIMLLTYTRYRRNGKKINDQFFNQTFEIANLFSRKVVESKGARLAPNEIVFYLWDTLSEIQKKELGWNEQRN